MTMGSTDCITYGTIHNATGYHRAMGLPAGGTTEVPAQAVARLFEEEPSSRIQYTH